MLDVTLVKLLVLLPFSAESSAFPLLHKNAKIKIHNTIILSVVLLLVGVQLGLSVQDKHTD